MRRLQVDQSNVLLWREDVSQQGADGHVREAEERLAELGGHGHDLRKKTTFFKEYIHASQEKN